MSLTLSTRLKLNHQSADLSYHDHTDNDNNLKLISNEISNYSDNIIHINNTLSPLSIKSLKMFLLLCSSSLISSLLLLSSTLNLFNTKLNHSNSSKSSVLRSFLLISIIISTLFVPISLARKTNYANQPMIGRSSSSSSSRNVNNRHSNLHDLNIDNDDGTSFRSLLPSSSSSSTNVNSKLSDHFLENIEGSGSLSSHHHRNPNNPNEDEEDDDDDQLDLEGSGALESINNNNDNNQKQPLSTTSSTTSITSSSTTTTSTTTTTTSTTTTTTMRPIVMSTNRTTTPSSSLSPTTPTIIPPKNPSKSKCKTPIDDEDLEGSGDCYDDDDNLEGSGASNFDTESMTGPGSPSSTTTDSSIVEIPSWTTSTVRPLTTSSPATPTTTTTTTTPNPPIITPSIDDSEFSDYEIPSKYIPPRAPSTSASFFARPGILAAVIGGTVVGLLCAILMVMFIVYRMRKKDEGSYAIDKSTITNSYRANSLTTAHNHHHSSSLATHHHHHYNHRHTPLHGNKQYS